MARILVTGVGGPAGQAVAALLVARGHAVFGVDARDIPPAGFQFTRVPLATAPDFLGTLAALVEERRIELLIPTVTEELPLVAAKWGGASPVPVMIGPAQGVCVANDKYLTCQRLSACGVSVPRYCLPSQVRSAPEVARRLGWPCLGKPRTGRGGRGVAVLEEGNWAAISAMDDASILQEFLPGVDYCVDTLVSRRPGTPPVVVVLEKTRLKEGVVGNAVEVQRREAPDVAALAVAAAACLGFIGPLDVDIRRGADGRPAVLEINARFGANLPRVPEILDAALEDWGVHR